MGTRTKTYLSLKGQLSQQAPRYEKDGLVVTTSHEKDGLIVTTSHEFENPNAPVT